MVASFQWLLLISEYCAALNVKNWKKNQMGLSKTPCQLLDGYRMVHGVLRQIVKVLFICNLAFRQVKEQKNIGKE